MTIPIRAKINKPIVLKIRLTYSQAHILLGQLSRQIARETNRGIKYRDVEYEEEQE